MCVQNVSLSLAKWLSVRLRTKWLWVRVPLQWELSYQNFEEINRNKFLFPKCTLFPLLNCSLLFDHCVLLVGSSSFAVGTIISEFRRNKQK